MSPKIQDFIEDMQGQVLMDNIDPESLSIIATNAMQMAARYKTADQDEKKKAEQTYFVATVLLHQLEQQARQLRQDINGLEERLSQLEKRQLEIAEFLDEIDNLIGPNGEYERDSTLDLIEHMTGKRPGEGMNDVELKALLAFEQNQFRAELSGIEDQKANIRDKIQHKQEHLKDLDSKIQSLDQSIHNPSTSPEQLEKLTREISELKLINTLEQEAHRSEADEQLALKRDSEEQSVQIDLDALM